MATGVQLLKSTDTSAPTLSGTAGDLTTLLDAALVNGYGSKSACGVGGAGAWSIDKTGTNKRVYKPSAGNRFGLRVRDNAGGTGGAQEALVRGADSWTDIDTPVANDASHAGPFPTNAQSALTDNSLVVRKSVAASGAAKPWIIVGDDRTVYMFNLTGDTASTYLGWMFGDVYSFLSGDTYRTMLIARAVENSGGPTTERLDQVVTAVINTLPGHYIARNHLGTSTPVLIGKHTDSVKNNGNTFIGIGSVPFPNAPDGGIYLAPIYIHDPTTSPGGHIRGRLRGLWCLLHAVTNYADGDTFTGTGDFAGRSFLVIKSSGQGGVFCVETSDTWEASS